jgi:hypothetical protein
VTKYSKNNPQIIQKAVAQYNQSRAQKKLWPWTVKLLSGFKYDHNIDYTRDKTIDIGPQSICKWCQALKWEDESPGMCCSNENVQLKKK